MATRRHLLQLLTLYMAVSGAGILHAQNYPQRTIRIVTNQPGAGFDYAARVIAQGIAGPLGQQVIVDNRPGNIIPAEIVAKAQPDGYTILFNGPALWIGALVQKMPYDPVADYVPITAVTSAPAVLVVHPSVPAKTVRELIALAKAKPGQLNYASTAIGSTSHLGAELFKYMAHVDIVHIPYKSAVAITDLIAGQVQMMIIPPTGVVQHIKSGKLRALAVTSAEPSALVPGLPTVASAGLPGYEAVSVLGLFGPAKMPDAIVRKLNQEIVRFLNTEEAKKKFLDVGAETFGSSPEQFGAIIKRDMDRLGKMIKEVGIRVD